jgi:hypothetical protein
VKREIVLAGIHTGWCCPGHDKYPNETYRSRRSKKARRRDKKMEHQHARTILNRQISKEMINF